MQVTLSPDQEAQLSRIAAQVGRGIDDLAHEAPDLYLAQEQPFEAAVEAGRQAPNAATSFRSRKSGPESKQN